MEDQPIEIKFDNHANPKSSFDMLRLEGLMQRKFSDHSIDKLHRIDFFLLLLVTEGNGWHTVDFTDFKIQAGTLLTVRKGQVQKFFYSENIKGYLLLFTDDFLVSYLEKLEAQKTLQLFNELLGTPKMQLANSDFTTIHNIVHRIDREYFDAMDAYALGIIRSELHILITKLFRIKSRRHPIVFEKKYLSEFIVFQKLVEQHVVESTRVSDYARMMAISTKTLNTISKSVVNKTAKEFIDEISIKQIKRLLINTSHSVKEIAYLSGFEETTNFYKYFKRQLGVTPEQFRAAF